MKGLTDTVKFLLQHGARLDMVNRDGWNALHLAVREGAENREWKRDLPTGLLTDTI